MAPSLAILSIPAYWGLALLPHVAATTIAANGNAKSLENRNPRGSDNQTKLKTKLGPQKHALYERLRGAHNNSLENLPLYVAAVFAGILADGVGKGGIFTGNTVSPETTRFIYSWFAIRAAYLLAYIVINDNRTALVRTAVFFAGVAVTMQQFWRAATVLGN